MKIPSAASFCDELDMGLSFADLFFSFLLSGEEEEGLTERVRKSSDGKGKSEGIRKDFVEFYESN